MTLKALATVVENEAREVLDSSLADLVEGRGLEILLVLSSWCGLTENDLGMDRMMAGSTMENDATTRNSSPVLLFGTPSHILAQNQSPVNELSEVQTIDQISPEIKKIHLVPPPPSLPNRAEEGERFILNLTDLLAPDEELATTAVSVGELVHWATKSQRAADNLARIDALLAALTILPCDEWSGRRIGQLMAQFEQKRGFTPDIEGEGRLRAQSPGRSGPDGQSRCVCPDFDDPIP